MRPFLTGACLLLGACNEVAIPDDTARATHTAPMAGDTPATLVQAAPSPPSLTTYVGAYPFDTVQGVRFNEHPSVRAAVRASGASATIARSMLDDVGPQTPIVLRAGRILSWGCEAHNCGPHNWSLFITKDGRDAEVCYHDAAGDPLNRWYADGKLEDRADDCPSGDVS